MATIEKRTTEDGSLSYRVRVRLKGHAPETATFARLTDARKWAQSVEVALREGRHFKTAEAKRHTLAELVDRYTRDILAKNPKAALDRRHILLWWKETIGTRTLADITPALLAECRDRLLSEGRANATASKYLAVLGHSFTVAVKEWGWLEDSPMRKVTKPKLPGGRVRFLSDPEREALLTACRESISEFLYPAVVLALATGMRRGEILGLCWREPKRPPADGSAWGVVHLDQGRIILHQTKNQERRTLPIAGPAAAVLQELAKTRRSHTDRVFPGHDPAAPVDLRTPWETALRRAGIDDFRFHDLRAIPPHPISP